jgi:signal transduction histidine kinase
MNRKIGPAHGDSPAGTADLATLGLLHDLRNPLSAAANAFRVLEVLIARQDEETRFFRDAVRASLRRAWHVVDEWQEALGAGAPLAPAAATDLRIACRGAVEDSDLRDASVSFHFHDCPRVRISTGAVRVIVRNLLSNAVRYRREGVPLKIVLGAHRRGAVVEVYVRDNGRGIPRQELPRVFEAFWRGIADRQDGLGLGLGLNLVETIVAQYGGRSRVTSHPGRGTTVSFTLPVGD